MRDGVMHQCTLSVSVSSRTDQRSIGSEILDTTTLHTRIFLTRISVMHQKIRDTLHQKTCMIKTV